MCWTDTYHKYFLASGNFYRLLISFASRFDPDQGGQSVLMLFQTVLHSDSIPGITYENVVFEKKQQMTKKQKIRELMV